MQRFLLQRPSRLRSGGSPKKCPFRKGTNKSLRVREGTFSKNVPSPKGRPKDSLQGRCHLPGGYLNLKSMVVEIRMILEKCWNMLENPRFILKYKKPSKAVEKPGFGGNKIVGFYVFSWREKG